MQAKAVVRRPQVSNAQAQRVANNLTVDTAKPLGVKAGSQLVSFQPVTQRSWLTSTVGNNGLQVTLDRAKITADLKAALTQVTQARNASFQVNGPTVTIVPSQDGTRCCAATALGSASAQGDPRQGWEHRDRLLVDKPRSPRRRPGSWASRSPWARPPSGRGSRRSRASRPTTPAARPESPTSTRMADAVRGSIIKPGQTFSLDRRVGQRTRAKGYVRAPEISNGVDVQGVGGGVSQFSTTLFNAAFFAGLDIVKYQAHSLYLDRYPYGREATLGWPEPDQKIKNNTPYGILIWTSYTATSVTVTLYSTQYAYGEQTGQTKRPVGACTGVTTSATTHYPSGRTTTDTFHAVYRPAEGVKCG